MGEAFPQIRFFIVGAQKCGTTTLARTLDCHPRIHVPLDEFPHFETDDPRPELERLVREKSSAHPDAILGLKRPNSLSLPEVPRRIARLLPRVLVIVLLRDPVERLVSAYFHGLRRGLLPRRPLNRALEELLAANGALPPVERDLLEFGRYATALRRYRDYFPGDQLLLLNFEQFVRHPQQTLERVLDRLGLAPHAFPKPHAYNQGAYHPLVLALGRLAEGLYLPGPRTGYERLRQRLGARVRQLSTRMVAPAVNNTPPPLEPGVRRRLVAYYAEEMTALRRDFGWDLSFWKNFATVDCP